MTQNIHSAERHESSKLKKKKELKKSIWSTYKLTVCQNTLLSLKEDKKMHTLNTILYIVIHNVWQIFK